MRRGRIWIAAGCLWALGAFGALEAAANPGKEQLAELKKSWKKLDSAERVLRLRNLQEYPSAALLSQARSWLKKASRKEAGELLRVVAACSRDVKLRKKAVAGLAELMEKHLDRRKAQERAEYRRVLKKYGKSIPGDDVMTAGRNWKDPYDERVRKLPPDIVEERAFMRAFLDAYRISNARILVKQLRRVFNEHHDPEVLRLVVELVGEWKEWGLLLDMADLVRIQYHGRPVGGSDVAGVGKEKYETQRLKWDVHKDRLWWSRPEYVLRVARPALKAASAVCGVKEEFLTATALDQWILRNEAKLAQHGLRLTEAFRKRTELSRD